MLYIMKEICTKEFDTENCIIIKGEKFDYKKALFFDLEHYVFRKPIGIGVFGCAYYDEEKDSIILTQYIIESKEDAEEILKLAVSYFKKAQNELDKKYLVTFSGENDYYVLNSLLEERGIYYNIKEEFVNIDLQKEFQKEKKEGIGLKSLEILFNIERESEVLKGVDIARTFGKFFRKDKKNYCVSKKKIQKIIRYNEQDVINLFYIAVNWMQYIHDIDLEKINMAREQSKSQI